jgi:hypothetical protein
MKSYLAMLSAALLLTAAACDFNPSSPFDGFDGGQGATLTGRFTQNSTAAAPTSSALKAQTALAEMSVDDLKVVVFDSYENGVLGDEIARVDVEDGTFTLRGLPEDFWVVFEDSGGNLINEDDPIAFEGVKPNQEVDVVLQMDDDGVVLVEETRTGIDHDEIEAEGRIENLDTTTSSFDVDGYTVLVVPGQTSIRKGNRSLTFDELRDGDQVHVRGILNDDGDLVAYEVKLQDEEEDDQVDDGKVTLCHIPPGNPSKKKTITVGASAVPAHLAHGDYLGACRP